MATEKMVVLATVTVTKGKEKRAEELWRILSDDVAADEKGRVGFQLHRYEESGQYIVIYEYASEKAREEYMVKPKYVEVSTAVREEGYMEHEPEIKFSKAVFGSGD